jgi:hypothetical protein
MRLEVFETFTLLVTGLLVGQLRRRLIEHCLPHISRTLGEPPTA